MFEGYHYVEKDGQGAKSRFADANALRAVFEKLRTDDLPDAKRRARIRRLYEGNLPYDPRKLEAAGLKVVDIHDLAAKARSIIGEPDALPFGDKVVGIVMDRHGKVLDKIYNIVD